MGLNIKRYYYSYHQLHVVREWVVHQVEKNLLNYCCYSMVKCNECLSCLLSAGHNPEELTNFPELICHSDCDGGYKDPVTKKDRRELMWGSLKALKNEFKILEKHEVDLPKSIKQIYCDLKFDVMSADKVLIFR